MEIWIKAEQQQNITKFHKFTLNPQYARITNGLELLVTYESISTVYNTPLSQLPDIGFNRAKLSVIVGGELVKYRKRTAEQKSQINKTYLVLNHQLAGALGISLYRELNQNKYISNYNEILSFCKDNLFTADFQEILNISTSGFIQASEQKIFKTSYSSNTLLFGNNCQDIAPFNGLKNGPYQAPPDTVKNVQFIMICHENDKSKALELYKIFKEGLNATSKNGNTYQVFPPLAEYIKQDFSTNKDLSITFSNYDTAVKEIGKSLLQKQLADSNTYLAIYISPIKKDDTENPHHSIYFKIKELLLDKGITSQVIYRERHNDQFFSYHLLNIAIALLAKLGGIPWRLQDTGKEDLIVGVGAFRSYSSGKKYVGSAFCFRKDGVFQNFDCYCDNNLAPLVAGIRKALMYYVIEHDKAERLIIHYYKTMSKKEAKPIVDMFYRLGLNIPVIVVTINKTETQDIVAFDTKASDLMPVSGTVVRVGNNQFLLYNSAKYDETFATSKGKKDYPFPIKVKIAAADKAFQFDNPLFAELLDQVYKFSRMYWKSVKQQNLPVTIKYPEMVAEIVPHFSDAELPPFGKTNLWFL